MCSSSSAVSRASLSDVPTAVLAIVIRFNPDTAPVLRAVSRALRQSSDLFLQSNAKQIVAWCTSSDSTLSGLLLRNLGHIRSCHNAPMRIALEWHKSLPRSIQALGVPPAECPNTIHLPQRICALSCKIEDENLLQVWRPLRQNILAFPALAEVPPEVTAPPQMIETWMHAHRTLLRSIATMQLEGQALTCVPKAIALYTGLTDLRLHNNCLVSLPEKLFQGLPALQNLYLHNNRLECLPEGLFQGLISLQKLSLNHNQLRSLPEGLFQGLTSLESLDLDHNCLESLPAGLFKGMGALQLLYLCDNQLFTLSEGLFDGLMSLRILYLNNNRLVILPEKTFLEPISLTYLSLYDNPSLLLSWDIPPYRNYIEIRDILAEVFDYPCKTSFAEFYQQTARGCSPEALEELFLRLPNTIKADLLERLRIEAGQDAQWPEKQAMKDLRLLIKALKNHVKISFLKLTIDEKQAVYSTVYRLANPEKTAKTQPNHSADWGVHHALENIPRLIDAILLSRSPF